VTAVAVERSAIDRRRMLELLRDNGVYVAMVIVALYNMVFTPAWFTYSNMKLQLVQTGPIMIVAIGMALVIGTGGIDLSVGATMAISASVIGQLLQRNANPILMLVLAILAGMVVGAIAGSLVTFAGVQPIVATLALLVAGRGLAQWLQASTLNVDSNFLSAIGSGSWLGFQARFWDAAVPFVLALLVMSRTIFGRRVVAIGDNLKASFLSGVPVKGTTLAVYIISGALAAWAGAVVVGANASTNPTTIGATYELFAITAVVVGGTPLTGGRVRLVGTLAGALLMDWISSSLIFHGISPSVSSIVTAVIIVLAVYLQLARRAS
jgi:ribose/xylose/arabinose/galactoside ABC-type transport system permease subunit